MTSLVQQARRGHPGLFLFAAIMAALVPLLGALAVLDQRTLLGVNIWFKPLKFAISLAAYAGTLAWLLGMFSRPRLVRAGWAIAAAAAAEMVIIGGQAARGVQSHFNIDTPVDSWLYRIMGATVAVIYIGTIIVAVLFLRESSADRPLILAIRFGVVISILGMTVGILMTVSNGHAVGVADGGPGLPFIGWSTIGGDLRVGHFIGMHALQVLPITVALLGAAAARGGRWALLDPRAFAQSVVLLATIYLSVVVAVTWQALRGQSLISPDRWTLSAAATIGVFAVAGVGTVRRSAATRRAERMATSLTHS